MVSWSQPPIIDCNGQITGYVIQYTRVGFSDMMNTMTVTNMTVFIPGLVENANYSVRVSAKNTNGTGPSSHPVVQATGRLSTVNLFESILWVQLFVL